MPFQGRILCIFSVLLLFACAPRVDKNDIVLWTALEGGELVTLKKAVDEFETTSGRKVELLKVPFTQLRGKVLVAGPAQQGPDLLIGPNDWIGILQTADLLAPVPIEDTSVYEVAKKAVTYDGALYSAPMMLECVVLARNTTLCPEKPESLDALVRQAVACQEKNPDTLGFAYQIDDFYFSWAFLAGFGADFLQPFAQADLSLEAINFDTPEAVAGARWVAALRQQYHLVPPGMKNDAAVDLFLRGRLGMMICGPWNLDAMRKSGVDFSLEALPPGPNHDSSPFVGVTGVMLSRFTKDKEGVGDLLTFLASPEITARLCQASGRAPAGPTAAQLLRQRISDPAVLADIELFADAAQKGTPLPNHPAMTPVWASMKEALELITTGQVQPQQELQRTTERVRAKIRFMTE